MLIHKKFRVYPYSFLVPAGYFCNMRVCCIILMLSCWLTNTENPVSGQVPPCQEQFASGEALYLAAKYDSSIIQLQQAYDCLPQDEAPFMKANMRIGGAYLYLSQLDSARKYIDIATNKAKLIADTSSWTLLLLERAVILQQLGNLDEAANVLLQATDLNRQMGADSLNTEFYVNLSMIYEQIGDRESDRKYSRKALAMARQYDRKPSELAASMSLASLFAEDQDLDSALILLNRVDTLNKFLNNPIYRAYNHLNRAIIIGGPDAQAHFLKCINAEQVPLYDRLNFRSYYTRYLLEKEAYQEALVQSQMILLGADSIGATPIKVGTLPHLIKAYVGLGSFEEAFYTLQSLQHLNDSIYSEETKNKVTELNVKYETALKEKKNQQLATANARKDLEIQQYRSRIRWRTLIAISSLAGLFVFIYMWHQHRQLTEKDLEILERRNELKEMELQRLSQKRELEVLEASMRGEEQERDRIARELHDGLGPLLSSIKLSILSKKSSDPQTSAGLVDRASSELRQIAQNLSPLNLNKFGLYTAIEDLCSDMSTDHTMVYFQPIQVAELELEAIKTQLYRMIQELVTNCIKHAEASEILVQLSKSRGYLKLIVEDNGIGMDTSIPVGKGHFGLINIQQRLSQLRGQMQIDSQKGKGTTIDIEVPLTVSTTIERENNHRRPWQYVQ